MLPVVSLRRQESCFIDKTNLTNFRLAQRTALEAEAETMNTQAQIRNLSLRQKEILRLIAQHMQAKEVAIALKISEHTVRTHTVSARRKLGVATSRDAARLLIAFESGGDTQPAIIDDECNSSSMIGDGSKPVPDWDHEQAIPPYRKIPSERGLYNPQLEGSGSSTRTDGPSDQISEYTGDDWRPSGTEQRSWAKEDDPHIGGGHSVANGWWLGFKPKLKRLSALQWLGVTLLVSAGMGILMGAFLAISLGFLETFEHIVRLTG